VGQAATWEEIGLHCLDKLAGKEHLENLSVDEGIILKDI
jgi:hypothetical protein